MICKECGSEDVIEIEDESLDADEDDLTFFMCMVCAVKMFGEPKPCDNAGYQ